MNKCAKNILTFVGVIAGALLCEYAKEKTEERMIRQNLRGIKESYRKAASSDEFIIGVDPFSEREDKLMEALKYAKGKYAVRLAEIWGTSQNLYVFYSREDFEAVWNHMA